MVIFNTSVSLPGVIRIYMYTYGIPVIPPPIWILSSQVTRQTIKKLIAEIHDLKGEVGKRWEFCEISHHPWGPYGNIHMYATYYVYTSMCLKQ